MCKKSAIDGATHPVCKTPYGLDGLTSFFSYKEAMREAIKKIKYRWMSDIAESIVNLIPNQKFPFPIKNKTLVSVPLHVRREKWRGFNQSELLGKLIAEKFGLGLESNVLKRVKNTKPQVEFKKEKRIANIKGAFSLKKNIDLSQFKNIILFDDVWTTGSTMRECAKVLKRNGANWVWGITIAR